MKLILAFAAFVVVALQLLNFADAQTDDTREPGASGGDVVDATVRLIGDVQKTTKDFYDDKKLLRRIALVETRYGTDNDTYRDNYHGGIWQVDEDMYNQTKVLLKSPSRLDSNIMRFVGIDWHATTWEDLRKPLYSGLAARLFLSGVVEPIPLASDVSGQAKYWKTYYDLPSGPGTEEEFIQAVLLNPDTCRVRGIDLVFLLDSSGSIGRSDFELIKTFTINVTNSLDIGPNDTQVAVIKYSSSAYIEFHLNEYDNKTAILQAISDIPYVDGSSATHLGLQAVLNEFNKFSRPVEEGFPRVAFVLTDGLSTSFPETERAAMELHMANIEVYAIATGENVNDDELSAIATTEHEILSTVLNISQLKETEEFLVKEVCKVNLIALAGQEFRGTLEVGEVAYFVYDLPEEGFTVKVEVTEGYVVIYVSTQVSNPNEALHDFKLVTNTTASVFVPPPSSSTDRERRQSPANDAAKVYISVEGHSTMMNLFILNTTIPPEPLKIKFVKDSPTVSGNNMTAFIHANKPVSDMKCRMSGTREVKNCTNGYVQFTGLPRRGMYTLKVVAETEEGETVTIKRKFRIEQPGYCTAHLINEGVTIEGQRVKVEFTPTGDTQSTACILNPPKTKENGFFPCTNPVTRELPPGLHMLKITPKGCGANRKPLRVYFEV